ncbi:MAG: hypothetical protein B6A08_16395 [Sorangiineae bacterium NIC37A_2]|nr:MAG: hypothetical protein B6A08_16395 [Sorangiineae bacterium NIC37A_2]
MSENNKKTPRTFQCRDALWEKFEEMARELECSVDYLINDSMKQYARQRGFAPAGSGSAASRLSSTPPKPELSSPLAASPRPLPVPSAAPPAPPAPPLVTPTTGVPVPPVPPPIPGRSIPAPPAPPGASVRPQLPSLGPLTKPSGPGGAQTVPLPPNRLPPLTSGQAKPIPPPPGQQPAQRTLVIHFEGNAYPVHKDPFVIGRGKQVSDLTIRDPNISRQHAAIEYLNGSYWMVDMGSTNGVEFNGQRVQRKQINNGEVYRICSHELLMSLT